MIISIYITFPDFAEAKKISTILLTEKLIACSNISKVESNYRWQDEIVTEGEVVLIGKSMESKWQDIVLRVEELHSYEVPCIIKYSVEANKKYMKWVEGEVKK